MGRFTVAESNKIITALNRAKHLAASNTASSTAASIHDIKYVQKNLDLNTNGTTYILMSSGELQLNTHQNINEILTTGALATGDLFFNAHNQVSGLSNYTPCFKHTLLVLSILQQHDVSFASELHLMQNDPPDTSLKTIDEIEADLKTLSPQLVNVLIDANQPAKAVALIDEDDDLEYEEQEAFEPESTSCVWPRDGHAVSRIGLFGTQNHQRTCSTKPPANAEAFMALLQQLEPEEQPSDTPILGN